MTPEKVTNLSALKGKERIGEDRRGSLATLTVDVAAAMKELRKRGVTNPDEFAHLDAETLNRTIRWFDDQKGRVGAGVLVAELRRGGKRPTGSLVDEQREYANQITAWLSRHFPDLDRPGYGPHPGAVAEVIRLHHVHGKRSLTVIQHGSYIRAAVKAFDERWGLL